jgi:hypothetical protein
LRKQLVSKHSAIYRERHAERDESREPDGVDGHVLPVDLVPDGGEGHGAVPRERVGHPGVAGDRAHAAQVDGDGDDPQADDPADAAPVAALEGEVEHLGDGVAAGGVVVGAQQVGYVLHREGDTEDVAPAHQDGDADRADDADGAVLIRVLRLLSLQPRQEFRTDRGRCIDRKGRNRCCSRFKYVRTICAEASYPVNVYWLMSKPRTKMYRLLRIPAPSLSVLKWVKTNSALALSVATVGTAIIRTNTPAATSRRMMPVHAERSRMGGRLPSTFQAAANWPRKERQVMGRLLMTAWLSKMAAWKPSTMYLDAT